MSKGIVDQRVTGIPTLNDPEMAEGLAKFARGERPELPRPPQP